jgi:hypothetical protein
VISLLEGQNLKVEYRYGGGETLDALAASFHRLFAIVLSSVPYRMTRLRCRRVGRDWPPLRGSMGPPLLPSRWGSLWARFAARAGGVTAVMMMSGLSFRELCGLRPHRLDHSALGARDLIGAQTHIGLDADKNLSAAISTASRRGGATPVAFRWDLQCERAIRSRCPAGSRR